MSDSNDEGMGIVRRRRSRRLLETRKAASKADDARVTAQSAAAAWGGILESERIAESSRPAPAAPPRGARDSARPASRVVDVQRKSTGFGRSQPVQGAAAKGPTQIIDPKDDPSASIEARMDAPLRTPVAPLRGVPLSNRPGAVAPPDEEARAARVSEKPRKRNSPSTSQPVPAQGARPTTKPPAVAAPPIDDAPPSADRDFGLSPEAGEALAQLEAEASELTRRGAAAPRGRSRKIVSAVVLVGLFLGACVWSTAIIFDEMGRSARLNRVADAVDARVAKIVEDTPELSRWVTERDAARLQALSEQQLPLFRETLRATGYAAGVPKVRMLPDASTGRLIVEVALPDATLALGSDGVWQRRPPGEGFGAALKANTVPILVGFMIPTLAAIVILVIGRRRRA